MSKYVIFTDTNCDLPVELADQLQLVTTPMKVIINGKTYENYLDYRQLSVKDFYKMMDEGVTATTTQQNPEDYVAALTPILAAGNDVLNIVFSSGLSGTFNSARLAADELRETFPERQIEIIDSKAASLGQGILVYLAALKKQSGASLTEVMEYTKSLVPHLGQWFTVNDLHHLKRGGRISAFAATVGTMLKFKPILSVDTDGKLASRHKERGRGRAISALVAQMVKEAKPGIQEVVAIAHGNCLEDALELEKQVRAKFEVKKLIINPVGPVIGSHTGQGILGLLYLTDKPNE